MLNKWCLWGCVLLGMGEAQTTIVISLGQACPVAGAMREYGIRVTAYPFDWIVSPFSGLYRALQENFEHFLQEDTLTIRAYDKYGIVDYYGFEFVHDFPSQQPNDELAGLIGEGHVTGGVVRNDWRDFLPQVRAKYQRRIERLHTTLSSTTEKVYFLRYGNTSQEEACQLRDLFSKKYPGLDFELILLMNLPGIQDWGLKNIRNFYLDETAPEQWKELFKILEV